ncbi:alginate export family protein [Rhodovibrionaceae bacterium A322]
MSGSSQARSSLRLPGGALALSAFVSSLFATSMFATGALAEGDRGNWRNLLDDAKPVFDVRYRYEHVDQAGVPRTANANTVRTRAGLETGKVYGIGAGFDAEWIQAIGGERFNNTINGKTRYPVVADPDDLQVNQAYLVFDDTIPDTNLKVGRQRIIWDNARFIGNVGFRQNEQTFDSFRGQVTAIPDTTLEYVYLDEVHRIFGTDSPQGKYDLNSHGLRAQYKGFEAVTLTPFALLLDYKTSSQDGLDSQTFGALASGSHAFNDDWSLLYAGALAYQGDYADNPANFDLWYYQIEPGVDYSGVKVKLGYEVLQGNGRNAFQTPLATLHKFNGFTDQFLTTPADGLQDLYLSLNAPLPGEGWLSGLTVKAGYHEFWAENGGSHYGSEWDAGIFKKLPTDYGAFNLGVQYASYNADKFSKDTDKLWLTLQFTIDPKPFSAY